ncbi:MAG: sulfite exporter TauE/SafE family protein [Kiloniellales bacterium]
MEISLLLLVAGLIFLIATVYASVGQAGATGYLAVMALAGVSIETMRPTALALNIAVASFTTYRFARAGLVTPREVLPFVACSIPLAFLGGWLSLPVEVYRPFLGVLLLLAAAYLVWQSAVSPEQAGKDGGAVPKAGAAMVGGVISFVSGLTGIGGGVLLSPVMLVFRWAGARRTAAITSAFILVNSAAALAGNVASVRALPEELPIFVVVAVAGGILGSELGIRHLSPRAIVAVLALVLLAAGGRFILF